MIYGFGIFVTNGMPGVISMYFNNADYPKTSSADYSLTCALLMFMLSIIGNE